MPIDDFKTKQFVSDESAREAELVKLIEWDIYAFMYIPNYLAEAGFEIRKG
jgi:hypothetical protein